MRQFRTKAIILNRTDYGEADRILTFLTPEHGKVKAIAKGVRKSQSKLAGGIELFSVSDLSFLVGKSEINTLRSSRLIKHYGGIVKDLGRTGVAYEFIKNLDKATEDSPEPDYFFLLQESFEALNDFKISPDLTNAWFNMQLLRLGGHTPNLHTDNKGNRLAVDKRYSFDLESMHFEPAPSGIFGADHIKLMRIGFGPNSIKSIARVNRAAELSQSVASELQSMLRNYVRP